MLPFLARFHYIAISIGRFIVGAAHGCIWPAFAGFWSSWAPAGERSRLIGTANAGSQIGNVFLNIIIFLFFKRYSLIKNNLGNCFAIRWISMYVWI